METSASPLSPALAAILPRLSLLKQEQFTGRLVIGPELVISPENEPTWTVYLFMGRLIYGTGGKHPARRWFRVLSSLSVTPSTLNRTVEQIPFCTTDCWEYEQLCQLVQNQSLSPEQAARAIHTILADLFLELAQVGEVACEVKPGISMQKQLTLLDPMRFVAQQQPIWERMSAAKLTEYPLSAAPIVRQPEALKAGTSVAIYQTLTVLLDGKHSLWDLSQLMKRPVLDVLVSLKPFLQAGSVVLEPLADLSVPTRSKPQPTANAAADTASRPLIACVDDSAWICQTLDKVTTAAGFRFIGIQDPLRAIPTVLSQKPALILLDLRMPNTNGYEICSQLRKLSAFTTIPIVILTGNDGVIDRVRAKMVGATDFISKSIDHEQLIAALWRNLNASGTGNTDASSQPSSFRLQAS
jgi:two-component system, chemotaxis family, response regulator PixG